jgi:hypothetical protein
MYIDMCLENLFSVYIDNAVKSKMIVVAVQFHLDIGGLR